MGKTTEFIDREKARDIVCSLCRWEGTSNCVECEHPIDAIPAADVRPVVLCGVCGLHGHCYTEDVFAFARLAEKNRFCAVGKVKKNGEERDE